MADKDAPPSTASGADRISPLPDGVWEQHMLSFLPAHEAVRTTVLARSWRDLWMRSPAFNITGWGTVAKFSRFLFRLLHLRVGTTTSRRHTAGNRGVAWAPLDSCNFSFVSRDFSDEKVVMDDALVNVWIQCVLCSQVPMLQFCFDDSYAGRFILHGRSLNSQHLTNLRPAVMAFKKSLDLSGFPALLDLEMYAYDSYLSPEEIWSPSLQHLGITLCYFHQMEPHSNSCTKPCLLQVVRLLWKDSIA